MLVLRSLICMPFLDRIELASLSGWSRGSVYGSLAELRSDGAGRIGRARIGTPSAYQALLRDGGRTRAAGGGFGRGSGHDAGDASGVLAVAAGPSREAGRRRFDLPAGLLAGPGGAGPQVSMVPGISLDAGIELAGGLTIGVVRQGLTSARTAFAKRIWRLLDEETPGLLLVLTRDEVRLRHAGRLLAAGSVPALIALEKDATTRGAAGRVWRLPSFGGGVQPAFRRSGARRLAGSCPSSPSRRGRTCRRPWPTARAVRTSRSTSCRYC